MMYCKRYILLITSVLSSFVLLAQYKSPTLGKANELLAQLKYYEAVNAYVEVITENPNQHEIIYKVAGLYEKLGNPVEALKWYQFLMKDHQGFYPEVQFKCAVLLKSTGNCEEAIKNFEAFGKAYSGLDKTYYSKIIKTEVEGCKQALASQANPNIQLDSLKLMNSSYTDLAPFVHGGKMYYATIPSDTPITYGEILEPQHYLRIVSAAKNAQGVWSNPKPFIPQVINEHDKHNSSGAFSVDGKRFYFTKCKENIDGINICKVYVTVLKDSIWQAPVLLVGDINDVNDTYSTPHISLNENPKSKKDILYFSSNMYGSKGGYDLWEVEIDDNFSCKNLKNLGTKINTEKDEITPSYSPKTKTLYFSSNGLMNFGGYDVYASPMAGKKTGKIKHLDAPVNSSSDDFYYHAISNTEAYFVSNRPGAKKYYQNYQLDDIFKVSQVVKKYVIVKTFEKDSAQKEIPNSSISIKNTVNVESKNIKTNEVFEVTPNTSYLINSMVSTHINGTKEFTFSPDLEDDTILVSLYLEKVVADKEIRLKNIYFDFDSAALKTEAKLELDTLFQVLSDNPNFTIEIGAHTDDKGKEKYNQVLSQKRAQSVVNYLINKGIAAERLIAVGYGSSKPIAPNKNPDGTDNPEGRQLNRRIVFKIVGTEISSKQ